MTDNALPKHWESIAKLGPQIVPSSLAGIAYGSRITDQYGSDSDYDLAIIVSAMPDQKESRRVKATLEEKTGLSIDLFFATPTGIQAKKRLDPMIYSLVKTGRLLWGELGDWWKLAPFSVDGVEDAVITVESLTDTGDFSDLTPGIAEYSWRLLDGAWAAWRDKTLSRHNMLPQQKDMPLAISSLLDTIRNSLQSKATQ